MYKKYYNLQSITVIKQNKKKKKSHQHQTSHSLGLPINIQKKIKQLNHTPFRTAIKKPKIICMHKYIQVCTDSAIFFFTLSVDVANAVSKPVPIIGFV